MMLGIVMTVLHLIPGLSGLAQTWVNASYNAKVSILQARIGGDVSVVQSMLTAQAVAEQARVGALQAIASSRVLSFLIFGFATPWIVYEAKVVVWDNVLGWGSTPAIHGDVGSWATTIIACLFGSGTIAHIGSMYFNRNQG
jgi:hypothetical protein